MKKFLVVLVASFNSLLMFGQSNNLPDVLSVKDALEIFKGGKGVAKSKLAVMNYKHYTGECGIYDCWTKNCNYICDEEKVSIFGKGTSSVVLIADDGIQIVVFNKIAFQKLKNQISAIGYKKNDAEAGAGTDVYEYYSRNNYPVVKAVDESWSRRTNYFYIEIWK